MEQLFALDESHINFTLGRTKSYLFIKNYSPRKKLSALMSRVNKIFRVATIYISPSLRLWIDDQGSNYLTCNWLQ